MSVDLTRKLDIPPSFATTGIFDRVILTNTVYIVILYTVC